VRAFLRFSVLAGVSGLLVGFSGIFSGLMHFFDLAIILRVFYRFIKLESQGLSLRSKIDSRFPVPERNGMLASRTDNSDAG
jgi:hypothetical protein